MRKEYENSSLKQLREAPSEVLPHSVYKMLLDDLCNYLYLAVQDSEKKAQWYYLSIAGADKDEIKKAIEGFKNSKEDFIFWLEQRILPAYLSQKIVDATMDGDSNKGQKKHLAHDVNYKNQLHEKLYQVMTQRINQGDAVYSHLFTNPGLVENEKFISSISGRIRKKVPFTRNKIKTGSLETILEDACHDRVREVCNEMIEKSGENELDKQKILNFFYQQKKEKPISYAGYFLSYDADFANSIVEKARTKNIDVALKEACQQRLLKDLPFSNVIPPARSTSQSGSMGFSSRSSVDSASSGASTGDRFSKRWKLGDSATLIEAATQKFSELTTHESDAHEALKSKQCERKNFQEYLCASTAVNDIFNDWASILEYNDQRIQRKKKWFHWPVNANRKTHVENLSGIAKTAIARGVKTGERLTYIKELWVEEREISTGDLRKRVAQARRNQQQAYLSQNKVQSKCLKEFWVSVNQYEDMSRGRIFKKTDHKRQEQLDALWQHSIDFALGKLSSKGFVEKLSSLRNEMPWSSQLGKCIDNACRKIQLERTADLLTALKDTNFVLVKDITVEGELDRDLWFGKNNLKKITDAIGVYQKKVSSARDVDLDALALAIENPVRNSVQLKRRENAIDFFKAEFSKTTPETLQTDQYETHMETFVTAGGFERFIKCFREAALKSSNIFQSGIFVAMRKPLEKAMEAIFQPGSQQYKIGKVLSDYDRVISDALSAEVQRASLDEIKQLFNRPSVAEYWFSNNIQQEKKIEVDILLKNVVEKYISAKSNEDQVAFLKGSVALVEIISGNNLQCYPTADQFFSQVGLTVLGKSIKKALVDYLSKNSIAEYKDMLETVKIMGDNSDLVVVTLLKDNEITMAIAALRQRYVQSLKDLSVKHILLQIKERNVNFLKNIVDNNDKVFNFDKKANGLVEDVYGALLQGADDELIKQFFPQIATTYILKHPWNNKSMELVYKYGSEQQKAVIHTFEVNHSAAIPDIIDKNDNEINSELKNEQENALKNNESNYDDNASSGIADHSEEYAQFIKKRLCETLEQDDLWNNATRDALNQNLMYVKGSKKTIADQVKFLFAKLPKTDATELKQLLQKRYYALEPLLRKKIFDGVVEAPKALLTSDIAWELLALTEEDNGKAQKSLLKEKERKSIVANIDNALKFFKVEDSDINLIDAHIKADDIFAIAILSGPNIRKLQLQKINEVINRFSKSKAVPIEALRMASDLLSDERSIMNQAKRDSLAKGIMDLKQSYTDWIKQLRKAEEFVDQLVGHLENPQKNKVDVTKYAENQAFISSRHQLSLIKKCEEVGTVLSNNLHAGSTGFVFVSSELSASLEKILAHTLFYKTVADVMQKKWLDEKLVLIARDIIKRVVEKSALSLPMDLRYDVVRGLFKSCGAVSHDASLNFLCDDQLSEQDFILKCQLHFVQQPLFWHRFNDWGHFYSVREDIQEKLFLVKAKRENIEMAVKKLKNKIQAEPWPTVLMGLFYQEKTILDLGAMQCRALALDTLFNLIPVSEQGWWGLFNALLVFDVIEVYLQNNKPIGKALDLLETVVVAKNTKEELTELKKNIQSAADSGAVLVQDPLAQNKKYIEQLCQNKRWSILAIQLDALLAVNHEVDFYEWAKKLLKEIADQQKSVQDIANILASPLFSVYSKRDSDFANMVSETLFLQGWVKDFSAQQIKELCGSIVKEMMKYPVYADYSMRMRMQPQQTTSIFPAWVGAPSSTKKTKSLFEILLGAQSTTSASDLRYSVVQAYCERTKANEAEFFANGNLENLRLMFGLEARLSALTLKLDQPERKLEAMIELLDLVESNNFKELSCVQSHQKKVDSLLNPLRPICEKLKQYPSGSLKDLSMFNEGVNKGFLEAERIRRLRDVRGYFRVIQRSMFDDEAICPNLKKQLNPSDVDSLREAILNYGQLFADNQMPDKNIAAELQRAIKWVYKKADVNYIQQTQALLSPLQSKGLVATLQFPRAYIDLLKTSVDELRLRVKKDQQIFEITDVLETLIAAINNNQLKPTDIAEISKCLKAVAVVELQSLLDRWSVAESIVAQRNISLAKNEMSFWQPLKEETQPKFVVAAGQYLIDFDN